MSKIQGFSKSRITRASAFAIVTLFAVTGVNPANAVGNDCVYTPALNSNHLVFDKQLGQGTRAMAWQWQPGTDAADSALSSLGTKVSVVTGNLRQITFGVLHQGIPRSQDLRALTTTNTRNIAALNGDYFDRNGPWSAMIQNGQVRYAPPSSSGVVGLSRHKVSSSTGYRSTGTLTIGTRKFSVTGVNQFNPGRTALVVYGKNYAKPTTPRGELTFVIKAGKISKIYPKGAALSTKAATVVQVNGYLAPIIAKMKVGSPVKLSLPLAPDYEDRLSADNLYAFGSVSSKTNTLDFDSVNFTNLSDNGATLFDDNFYDVTRAGRATLRISPDNSGNLIVRKVFKYGSDQGVGAGGYIIQANGAAASAVAKFRVGEIVQISNSYRTSYKFRYVEAAGRGPRVLEGGKFTWNCATHNKDLRPRSAIGWNQDGQVWLISSSRGFDAIDLGFRQGGSTTSQMGEWLLSLGATDAVLLDGGGSTTMQIKEPQLGWNRLDLPGSAWYRELANALSIQSKN